MEFSMTLARVIGPVLVLVSLGALLNMKRFMGMVNDFLKNEALMFYAGVVHLVLGLVLVMKHNYWVGSWEVIITILVWLVLVKGALIVVFPEQAVEISKSWKSKNMLTFWAVVDLIVGGALIYVSYLV